MALYMAWYLNCSVSVWPAFFSLLQAVLPTARLVFVFLSVFMLVRKVTTTSVRLPLPPGPWGVPFLGFLPFLGENIHLTLTELGKQYGPIYQIFLGGKRLVVVNDSRVVREAFRQPVFSGRPDTELTRLLQGYGIVNSDGELWQEQRSFLHTMLRQFGAKSSIMSGKYALESKIKTQVSYFMDELREKQSKPFYFRPVVGRAVSNIVGSLLCSTTFDDREDKNFSRLLDLFQEGVRLFTVAAPVNFLPILRYLPGVNYAYRKIKMNRQETGNYFKKITDEHKDTLDDNSPRDIMDAYLVQQNKMESTGRRTYFSETQLIQIMNDIFSAGLETVTSTLEWAALFLVRNQHVQKKIQEEIEQAVGRNRIPELSDLPNMPYTEATIYEVLRRSNVVVLGNAHATTADAELCGYFIPKGTHVLANHYAIHMDPANWERPEEFIPERFIKDGQISKPDFFIPFSTGRRMCLGDVLTKMEVFLFLVNLLCEFDLTTSPEDELPKLEGVAGATMSPKPFRLLLKSRDEDNNNVTSKEESK